MTPSFHASAVIIGANLWGMHSVRVDMLYFERTWPRRRTSEAMPPVADLIVMTERPQFQFSVAALLVTTTVLAVVVAGVATLDIPFSNPFVLVFFGSYFVFAAILSPHVFMTLRELARRHRQILEKRAAIERELRQIKAARPPREGSQTPLD